MSRVRQTQSSAAGYVVIVVGVALLLLFAKVLLIPLAFALTLSFLLAPAVAWLERKHLPRTIAVTIASGLTCVVLVFGAFVLSRQVLNVAQTLPGYRANIQKKIESLHSSSESALEATMTMVEDLSTSAKSGQDNAVPVRVVTAKSEQLWASEKMLGQVLEPLAEVGIVIIFTIYMLMNWEDLRHRLLLLAGMANMNLMSRALDDATGRISRYLVMQFQVNACYGILFGGGLYFLHVPEATLWGVIAGTIRIVPFVGTLIGMLLPLSLSIAVSTGWLTPLCVVGFFLVLEVTTVNVVEPWLFSSRTGISSLALLASAIFWSMLWGWPGLVLSTPLTVGLVVMGRYVPQLSFLHSLLGTNAKLSPAAHVYERLLAMDQREAWAIAEKYLEDEPLVKLYDAVVLPVLSLAEEDRQKGALDAIQAKFVLLSMRELVARITVDDEATAERETTQKEFAIVCLAAGGRAAELATLMLTQLLENSGHQTLMMMADSVSDEILKALAAEESTVIFISGLPPFAFAQTRAVCQRVRTHLPNNRIAVALWSSDEEGEEFLERFGSKRPDVVLKTMAQAVGQVESWQTTR